MKKQFSTLLLLLGAFFFASAQSNSVFQVLPNPVDTTGDADDVPAHAEITNLTNNTINLRWERTVINITDGCETAVCDPNTCYSRTVSVRNLSMDPNEHGELTMHFYTNGVFCEGIVHLKVKNLDNPNDSLVVVYTLNQNTDVKDLPAANVKLFPNPFVDHFSLENASDVAALRIFSMDGREIARLETNPYNVYYLHHQPAGTYILALEDKNGRVFQAMEINKR